MLSILGPFLLFLGNVNAQGKEPLPKRCEKIYERFIKNHTRVLSFLLAEVTVPKFLCETPLPANLTGLFKECNYWYNPFLVWDNRTAQLALKESITPHSVKNASLKVRATHDFWMKDNRTLEQKVHKTLQSRLERIGMNVTALPYGSLFGCNGTYYPTEPRMTTITVVCLYYFRLVQ